jgi:hypothetical protein
MMLLIRNSGGKSVTKLQSLSSSLPRIPFVPSAGNEVSASIISVTALALSGYRVCGRRTEISLTGCFVDMANPLPEGKQVFVKIFTRTGFFKAHATVIYSQERLGVGLNFDDISNHHCNDGLSKDFALRSSQRNKFDVAFFVPAYRAFPSI